ncbi:hypothetical protein D9M72_427690 [compost metagenome]
MVSKRRCRRFRSVLCNHRVDICAACRRRQRGKISGECFQLIRGDETICKPGMDRIGCDDVPTGQTEIGAEFAGGLRKKPGGANVREVADPGLRHRKPRAFGDDAVAAVGGNPDTAAHDDTVHDRNVRLAVAGDAAVDDEFLAPELRTFLRPFAATLVNHADIATGAKPALALAGHQHGGDGRIIFELGQSRGDQPDHRHIEAVQCPCAVQPDSADRSPPLDDDFRRLHVHERSFLFLAYFRPISERATIRRMISLVPSRIWCTRRSLTIFSTP